MKDSFYKNLKEQDEIKVMGILNVTPDSFSDGGKYFNTEKATEHAIRMLNDGADIIDIGGESSRPGAKPISIDEELSRTIPVIKSILKYDASSVISIDTVKPEVADLALEAGVLIINDISGFKNEILLNIANDYDATLVIMHMKGIPQTMQHNPSYINLIEEVYKYFMEKIDIARKSGVYKIIIDPGIGFGKTVQDNFTLLKSLKKFTKLELPILIGVSKKSLIGNLFDLPLEERELATSILETFAVNKGTKIIRTHNVKNGVQLKKLHQLLRD